MAHPVIAKISELGQSIWYDNIRRGILESGELQSFIDEGVTGVTSNPSIFKKAIADSNDYRDELAELISKGVSAMDIYETLAFADIRAACDLFRAVYDRTDGDDGYVSIEVPPAMANETKATIAEAKRIFSAIDRPNVMIKIPATDAGMPAVEEVIASGINVNITLIFSCEVYRSVINAYLSGLERWIAGGGNPRRVASVASFFVSRVDTLVDKLIAEKPGDLANLAGKAAVANSRNAYQLYKEVFGSDRFAALKGKGARVQRPLWASTSTKNPEYHDLLYVETLIGPDTVNTVPPATLDAIKDHGQVELTVERELSEGQAALARLEAAGIHMADVTEKLKQDGVRAFADSFDDLINAVQSQCAQA